MKIEMKFKTNPDIHRTHETAETEEVVDPQIIQEKRVKTMSIHFISSSSRVQEEQKRRHARTKGETEKEEKPGST